MKRPPLDEELAELEQVIKLAGTAPILAASAATNWNTGVGTSGEAGADLLSIGGAGIPQKIVKLLIGIANATAGSNIEVRVYGTVNGVAGKRLAYSTVRQVPAQGTNPDIIDYIAQTGGPIEIDGVARVELYSSTNEAIVINTEYKLELR